MKEAFKNLMEFHSAHGEATSDKPPCFPDSRVITLREDLIAEEFDELIHAIVGRNLPEVADALADLAYVVIGTAVSFGIDLPSIWDAVHKANMAKFGKGAWRDETGKTRKPPGWVHPDIGAMLATQKPLAELYPAKEESQ